MQIPAEQDKSRNFSALSRVKTGVTRFLGGFLMRVRICAFLLAMFVATTALAKLSIEVDFYPYRAKRADVIVVGKMADVKVTGAPKGAGEQEWTLEVEEVLKGKVGKKPTVVTAVRVTRRPSPHIPSKGEEGIYFLKSRKDGKYSGACYRWRANKNEKSGVSTAVTLLEAKDPKPLLIKAFCSKDGYANAATTHWVRLYGPHKPSFALELYLGAEGTGAKSSSGIESLLGFWAGDSYYAQKAGLPVELRLVSNLMLWKLKGTPSYLQKALGYAGLKPDKGREKQQWAKLTKMLTVASAGEQLKKQITEIVKGFLNEEFKVRERANDKLKEMIEQHPAETIPVLQELLKASKDPEVKDRIEKLLSCAPNAMRIKKLRDSVWIMLLLLDEDSEDVRQCALKRLRTLTSKEITFDVKEKDKAKRRESMGRLLEKIKKDK
jgi:hypothetical protein